MKAKKQLDEFEYEFEYFDYLVSIQRKPNYIGITKNIDQRIESLKKTIKIETENYSDKKVIERAILILQKFEALRERHNLICSKE